MSDFTDTYDETPQGTLLGLPDPAPSEHERAVMFHTKGIRTPPSTALYRTNYDKIFKKK